MAITEKYNVKSSSVKRILQEMREMEKANNSDFIAEALEEDIFEWHFAIRGPVDSEYEGGIYHGRLLIPPEYPFKPPEFMLLTPNGRWETGVKICLSISSHHPEHWQPSWSIRTALTALTAFMPTPGAGAIGALECPKEERKKLARLSQFETPKFGSSARQQVTDSVHARMRAWKCEASSSAPEELQSKSPIIPSETNETSSKNCPNTSNTANVIPAINGSVVVEKDNSFLYLSAVVLILIVALVGRRLVKNSQFESSFAGDL